MDAPLFSADLPTIITSDPSSPLLSSGIVQGMSAWRRASDSALHQGLRPPSSLRPYRTSIPSVRLHLSIPKRPELPLTIDGATDTDLFSGSDSTEDSPVISTPTSSATSSPISGVVDLSAHVSTTSAYAIANGGLSDIYTGIWTSTGGNGGAGENIPVSTYQKNQNEECGSTRIRSPSSYFAFSP